MESRLSEEDIKFNSQLDARHVLGKMDVNLSSVVQEGDALRLYCPIHKDTARRSMTIDLTSNAYKCSFTPCPAHLGGTLLELYALYMNAGIDQARRYLGDSPAPIVDLVVQAEHLIDKMQLLEALPLLRQAMQESPGDPILRCKLAALHMELNDRESGVKEYMAAAETFAKQGELQKTISIYSIIVMLSPDDIRARQELGFLYSRLGKPEEAADHFKWVIDRLLAKNDPSAALEVCRKMTMQDPSDPNGHYQRASILLSQNRLEEALPAIEKAAQLFLQKGNPLKARDTANLGLRHFPSSAALSELLEKALEATRPAKVQDEAAAKQEEEFSEWISSLEDEISAAPIEREPVTTGFVSRDDLRVLYFRDQIALMNDEQLGSMEKHLKTMYSDIQELYQKGLVESQEVRTVKQFYRAFCIALEQNKRMR
ncbi:MAG: hypothetical protein V2A74_14860 [bacterium]